MLLQITFAFNQPLKQRHQLKTMQLAEILAYACCTYLQYHYCHYKLNVKHNCVHIIIGQLCLKFTKAQSVCVSNHNSRKHDGLVSKLLVICKSNRKIEGFVWVGSKLCYVVRSNHMLLSFLTDFTGGLVRLFNISMQITNCAVFVSSLNLYSTATTYLNKFKLHQHLQPQLEHNQQFIQHTQFMATYLANFHLKKVCAANVLHCIQTNLYNLKNHIKAMQTYLARSGSVFNFTTMQLLHQLVLVQRYGAWTSVPCNYNHTNLSTLRYNHLQPLHYINIHILNLAIARTTIL